MAALVSAFARAYHYRNNAVRNGCRQIVIHACGYDTFSLRTRDVRLRVFEPDRPGMIEDRRSRIVRSGLEPVCQVDRIGCGLSGSG